MLPVATMSYQYVSPLSTRRLFDWFLVRFLSRGKKVKPLIEVLDTPPPPKFCMNCQYFLSKDNDTYYAKCTAFPKFASLHKDAEVEYRVSGVYTQPELDYYFCSTVRGSESMCGKNGTRFIPRETVNLLDIKTPGCP